VPHPARFWSSPLSIFVVRRRGKAAVIIALFQGFATSHGGKKTSAILQVLAGWGTDKKNKWRNNLCL